MKNSGIVGTTLPSKIKNQSSTYKYSTKVDTLLYPYLYMDEKDGIVTIDNSNEDNVFYGIPYYNDGESDNINFKLKNKAKAKINGIPKNVFFMTCDNTGVLPPVSRLNPNQALFYFLNGYSHGYQSSSEEHGDSSTYQPCYGAVIDDLNPCECAEDLRTKIRTAGAQVWLINTGNIGGSGDSAVQITSKQVISVLKSILNGSLNHVRWTKNRIFNLEIPTFCAGIPLQLLDSADGWNDRKEYERNAHKLKEMLEQNFKKYSSNVKMQPLGSEKQVTT